MPRNPYPGKKIFSDDKYYETHISFDKIYNMTCLKDIKKPLEQGSLDEDKVQSMVNEYKNYPYFLRFKNRIVIGNLNNTWYVIDGQHRLEMSKLLYESNINDELIFCWFTCDNEEEMRMLFNSINKDSAKNKFYIDQTEFSQVKINEFIKMLKSYNKKSFSNKKSNFGKIKTISELRDELIEIDFFKNDLSTKNLYSHFIEKNNQFYEINRYKINLDKNPDNFYKDEQKHIQNKIIFSLKNSNFIKWIYRPNKHDPYHKFKRGKKRISRQLKLKSWNKEFLGDTGICPIKNCSAMINKNNDNWHAGHVISEYNNGETIIDNLRPICRDCNLAMSSKNWEDYEKSI